MFDSSCGIDNCFTQHCFCLNDFSRIERLFLAVAVLFQILTADGKKECLLESMRMAGWTYTSVMSTLA